MFSKELEELIEATLQDGVLSENEKKALIKRALLEGVDIAELDIYINSKLQKRVMDEKVLSSKDKPEKKQSNRCPHCGSPIPPLSKTCPGCGAAVSVSTTGDSELFALIDQMEQAMVHLQTCNSSSFSKEKAEAESLLRKAKMFYGDNKKVQMIVFDLENRIKELNKTKRAQFFAGQAVYYSIMSFLGFLTLCTIWFGFGIVFLVVMIVYYMYHNQKFIFKNN